MGYESIQLCLGVLDHSMEILHTCLCVSFLAWVVIMLHSTIRNTRTRNPPFHYKTLYFKKKIDVREFQWDHITGTPNRNTRTRRKKIAVHIMFSLVQNSEGKEDDKDRATPTKYRNQTKTVTEIVPWSGGSKCDRWPEWVAAAMAACHYWRWRQLVVICSGDLHNESKETIETQNKTQ